MIPIFKRPSPNNMDRNTSETKNINILESKNLDNPIPVYSIMHSHPSIRGNMERPEYKSGVIINHGHDAYATRLGKKKDNEYNINQPNHNRAMEAMNPPRFDYLLWNPQTPFINSNTPRHGENTR